MGLFRSLPIRGVVFPNRIGVSPMCQYSYQNGMANEWLMVHLGARAVGGAGAIIAEASAVLPEGRISPYDLGIWSDAHAQALQPIVHFVRTQGSVAGIQLAHAGRKASTARPWEGNGKVTEAQGGWNNVYGPSDIPFSEDYPSPHEMTGKEIENVRTAFVAAAQRAAGAGFQFLEIHAAHGYLLHEFLSPLSNRRTDAYGGNLHQRAQLLYEVVEGVRSVISGDMPLFVRISSTDWVEGGITVEDMVKVVHHLKTLGVDLIDCSSGGNSAKAKIPVGPGYQTEFAAAIRSKANIMTAAVGMITDPAQAAHILNSKQADMVLLAREMLRDPYWPLHAAEALGEVVAWPAQYARAARGHVPIRPLVQ